jgi:hypothetical protein
MDQRNTRDKKRGTHKHIHIYHAHLYTRGLYRKRSYSKDWHLSTVPSVDRKPPKPMHCATSPTRPTASAALPTHRSKARTIPYTRSVWETVGSRICSVKVQGRGQGLTVTSWGRKCRSRTVRSSQAI